MPESPRGPLSEEDLVRLLTPAGERVADPVYDEWTEALDADRLRMMYRDMVLVRRFDAEATALQRQGELGLWVPSLGQEAAQVGSAHALAAHDFVFPSYREHGVAHVRGVDFVELLALFRGVDHGGWDAMAHGMQDYTLVVGAQPLHAPPLMTLAPSTTRRATARISAIVMSAVSSVRTPGVLVTVIERRNAEATSI